MENNNIFRYKSYMTCFQRNRCNGYRSGLVWLMGPPGTGKPGYSRVQSL
jgi:hypothetical protein